MAKKVARGVFRDQHGLRAYVRIKGTLRSQRFKPDGLQRAIRWREEVKAKAALGILPEKTADIGTLAADAERYLASVRGMPSFSDRKRDIDAWVAAYGTRPRQTITALDVRTQLDAWKVDRKLAASTLNHRRTALMHLYRVLDGRSAPNPVADVPKYHEQTHAALIYTPKEIARVLKAMPDTRYKRVLAVMAWTGWPYRQICQLTKADLSKLKDGIARVTPRRKGAGSSGRWLPLLPAAIVALKALRLPTVNPETEKLEGDTVNFHRRVAWQHWREGCEAANLTPCRPYDLRHAFGTRIASATSDARAVYELMLHADPKQALRYTTAAGMDRAQQAIAIVTSGNFSRAKASKNLQRRPRKKLAVTERKRKKPKRARKDSNLRPPA